MNNELMNSEWMMNNKLTNSEWMMNNIINEQQVNEYNNERIINNKWKL